MTTPSRLASATAAASCRGCPRGVRDLVGVGHQGDPFQEGAQRTLRVVPLVFTDDGDEFREVLHPGLVLRVGAGPKGGEVAGLFQDGLQGGGRAGAGRHLGEVVEQLHKALDRVDGTGGHAGGLVGAAGRGHKRDPVALRQGGHGALGPVTDAAFGLVQDAAQVDVVVRVDQDAQVGEGVLDFLALVEARAADHLVRQPDADQDILDGAGLGVGAVEDGDVAGTEVAFVLEPVDFLGDELGFVVLVLADVADDLLAVALRGPQPLLRPVGVAGDDRVGGAEDGLGGAVVLLELDGAGVRVVLLELHDVADVGAAEGVDGLVRVADDGQLGRAGAFADDLAHQRVLGVVGVLVFVDQDVPEAAPVGLGERGEGPEHVDRLGDQVIEVHGVGLAQPLRVALEDLGDGLLEGVVVVGAGGVAVSVDQLVLERGNLVLDGLGGEAASDRGPGSWPRG